MYVPAAALVELNPAPQPITPNAVARESASTANSIPILCFLNRQKKHPKPRLPGKKIPASCVVLIPGRVALADVPPVNGEFESTVTCTVWVCPDFKLITSDENVQVTTAGSPRHPI